MVDTCLSVTAHASQELKDQYFANIYSCIWVGGMGLSGPDADTGLGILLLIQL
jgi:hypothetical protein